ncbi:MAG: Hsp70 family protein [Pseudomonadota bacterium]
MNASHSYWIGIDLGTTHTVVAFAEIGSPLTPQILLIPQWTEHGEWHELMYLPSFRYHPDTHQWSASDSEIEPYASWIKGDPIPTAILGECARRWGQETQGRGVHSAKSWLSQSNIDPEQSILPWNEEQVEKISPVDACASYLRYVHRVWNDRFPNAPMAEQVLVITLPASFDDGARGLTLEAARRIGLENITLLEEPTAAFYHYANLHQDQIYLTSQRILVCDMGGGTLDFSLIDCELDEENKPVFQRIGIGDHILLGGDNMDWLLAQQVHQQWREAHPHKLLNRAALQHLVQRCRIAKEQLLSIEDLESVPVIIQGQGSSLLASQWTTHLTQSDVKDRIKNQFFPIVDFSTTAQRAELGLQEWGLDYTADARVTAHLAEFLNRYISQSLHQTQLKSWPDRVLLNGGVFKSTWLIQIIADQLAAWSQKIIPVEVVDRPSDAVALGAVQFLQAQSVADSRMVQRNIRSYFLTLNNESAICLLPANQDSSVQSVCPQTFALKVNQKVQFQLWSSIRQNSAQIGQVCAIQPDWIALPPLSVMLTTQQNNSVDEIAVRLSAKIDVQGRLRVVCNSIEHDQQWELAFPWATENKKNHRSIDETQYFVDRESFQKSTAWHNALEYIEHIFGQIKRNDTLSLHTWRQGVEKNLGSPDQWNLITARGCADALLARAKQRRRSAQHERLWWSWLGFSLRPGWGAPEDEQRIQQLEPLWENGIQFIKETQNWTAWWTFWRRISGGLSSEFQQNLWKSVSILFDPSRAKHLKYQQQHQLQNFDQCIRCIGALENLPVSLKIEIGDILLRWFLIASYQKYYSTLSWALGRLGARLSLHASTSTIVPAASVESWLKALLALSWPQKQTAFSLAVAWMARLTPDKNLNINSSLRVQVLQRLIQAKAPQKWQDWLTTIITDRADTFASMGESLPMGLVLIEKIYTRNE